MGRKPLDPIIKAANRKATLQKASKKFRDTEAGKLAVKKYKDKIAAIDTLQKATKAKFLEKKKEAGLTSDEFLNLLLDKK